MKGAKMTREIGGGDPFLLYMKEKGSSERNHAQDYCGVEPTVVRVKPIHGVVYVTTSVLVFVKAPKDKLAPDEYGHLPTLLHGIGVVIRQDGQVVADVTDGVPIRCNADWLRIGRISQYLKGEGKKGSSYWVSRWEYHSVGEPIFLDGTKNMDFAMLLQDDFSALEEHYFILFGYSRPK